VALGASLSVDDDGAGLQQPFSRAPGADLLLRREKPVEARLGVAATNA
jgi:hypothetical protein